MRPRRTRVRAVAAWLVVVTLTLPGSLGAQLACDVCPPDCPMHAVVAAPEADAMPCHRAPKGDADAAPTGGVADPVLRAACGHVEAGDLALQLRHLPPVASVMSVRSPVVVAWPAPTRPREPARSVPTRPPQRELRS